MANEALLFAVLSASGGAVVEPRGQKPGNADDRRKLPREGGKSFFLFNGPHKMRYRVVEIH